MQSDAFPTPPIYSYLFQPSLIQPFSTFENDSEIAIKMSSDFPIGDRHFQKLRSHHHSDALSLLLNEIETLIDNCSIEEAQLFWSATDCLKLKHS
jgi:hypothetical protein